MSAADWFRWDGDDLVLQLKLQPRAANDGFAGLHDGRLKLRITAPPIDGRANAHLSAWLAKCFAVSKSDVSIESGQASTLKRVRIRAPRHLPDDLAGQLQDPRARS